jgi:shikimate dehydrogenase
MSSYPALNGETRVLAIIGDPIAQVKSPAGVTRTLQERGCNAVLVPVHVAPADMDGFVNGASLARNIDGIIVTVPHKFSAYKHCASVTDRAQFLGAVNIMRRNADGGWHGDQLDGLGFVNGMRTAGGNPDGARALLVGAGGAGSAIALALLESGVAELAVHDDSVERRDALLARLGARYGDRVGIGSPDPAGCNVVVNATPSGMRPGDPFPLQADRLTPDMFVGDVITAPAVTPLIEVARGIGCRTQVGTGMFAEVAELMIAFLLEEGPLRGALQA